MNSEKIFKLAIGFIIALAVSCSNTYNNLIPNDKQNILEFSLSSEDHKTRSVSSEICENYITVKVPKGTDITKLFPKAVLPKHATLFPLTLRYLQEAFPRTDVLDMALRINPAKKGLENWFLTLYEENPDFSIPPLVFPINFFYPVTFVVIGGQGGVEIYTVKVIYDDGSEPDVEDLPDPNLDESKKILSFYVPDKQKGSSTITHNTIDFTLKAGTDLRCLLPEITTEPDAVAIPLTKEYLFEISSQLGVDPLSFAQGYIDSPDKRAFIKRAIATSDTSNLSLAIDKIIDFTNPIQIVVLGKLNKSVRLYTATATLDSDDAYLKTLAFTKAKNPNLIKDYLGEIFQEQKKITCTLYYPYEYGASGDEKAFELYLDSQYTGTKLTIEYNGKEYSLNDAIPFKPIKMENELYYLGNARAKLHVDNGDLRKTYSLELTFKEDPDTIRSITDFRFETFYNSKIKATSIASIVNRDDEGEIRATVLYSGELPNKLIPSFITGGGKVLVDDRKQISKSSEQDFSSTINYVCVSKVGNYERVYTVSVEFIKVETPEVILKSFKFPLHLNKEISQDAIGVIDEAHGTVSVDVVYDGSVLPYDLVAEFSATGAVSIEGITQSSGFSTQNYKYDVYLKVTALDDENVSKTYRVHVTFNYSTQNKCKLLRFYFEKEKNLILKETVEGYISPSSYNVYALVSKECDVTQLIPSFEAEGIVKVADAVQTSGSSSQDFTNIVEYVVVSENGQNSKTYKVKVQKQGDIIYLNQRATGKNNGSTWKDAFRKLEDAIEAANRSEGLAEIWVSRGQFVNIDVKLSKTVIIRGGFEGNEANESERGSKYGGTIFNNVWFSSKENIKIEGTLIFDGIMFKSDFYTSTMKWQESEANSIVFEKCDFIGSSRLSVNFSDVQKLEIKNSTFEENTRIDIDAREDSSNNGELIIEDSEMFCKIECALYKEQVLNILKIKNSVFSQDFSIVASSVEFEKVRSDFKKVKAYLYNVEKTASFINVRLDSLIFIANNRKELGDFSFKDCNVFNIEFLNKGESYGQKYSNEHLMLGSVEFKNCKEIKNINFAKGHYIKRRATSLLIENSTSEIRDLEYYNYKSYENSFIFPAQKLKIKDTKFFGRLDTSFSYNNDESYDYEENCNVSVEVKDSTIFDMQVGTAFLDYMNERKKSQTSNGILLMEKSHFYNLAIYGGDEIIARDVGVDNVFFDNRPTKNSKIKFYNAIPHSTHSNVECYSNSVEFREVNKYAKLEIRAENLVDVRKCDFTKVKSCFNYDKELIRKEDDMVSSDLVLFGANIIFKENKFKDSMFEKPLVTVITKDNFDIWGNSTDDFSLSFYSFKPYTFKNKSFGYINLLHSGQISRYYYIKEDEDRFNVTFESCNFYSELDTRAKCVELKDCIAYSSDCRINCYSGKLKTNGMLSESNEERNVSIYEKGGEIEINNWNTILCYINLLNGGLVKVKNSNKVAFRLKNANLEMDNCHILCDEYYSSGSYNIAFSASSDAPSCLGSVKIKNSSFKTTDVDGLSSFIEKGHHLNLDIYDSNIEVGKSNDSNVIFLNAEELSLTNCIFQAKYPYFIHEKNPYMIDASELKAKNTKFIGTEKMYSNCIYATGKVEMEKCSFQNAGKMRIDDFKLNGCSFQDTTFDLSLFPSTESRLFKDCDFFHGACYIYVLNKFNGRVEGPIAVKFEYDMDNLPSHLRYKGFTTIFKIKNALSRLIKGSRNRVGYFLNLGDDEPSNSHQSKFLGSYH